MTPPSASYVHFNDTTRELLQLLKRKMTLSSANYVYLNDTTRELLQLLHFFFEENTTAIA
jgi:hypothetical protein